MATPAQIEQARLVGYEHGYLKIFNTHQVGRMTLENTSKDQFKHDKVLSQAWERGLQQYRNDLRDENITPYSTKELEVGKYGPFSSFYSKTDKGKGKGKKSKRRGGENKNKTQKKNRRQNKKRN